MDNSKSLETWAHEQQESMDAMKPWRFWRTVFRNGHASEMLKACVACSAESPPLDLGKETWQWFLTAGQRLLHTIVSLTTASASNTLPLSSWIDEAQRIVEHDAQGGCLSHAPELIATLYDPSLYQMDCMKTCLTKEACLLLSVALYSMDIQELQAIIASCGLHQFSFPIKADQVLQVYCTPYKDEPKVPYWRICPEDCSEISYKTQEYRDLASKILDPTIQKAIYAIWEELSIDEIMNEFAITPHYMVLHISEVHIPPHWEISCFIATFQKLAAISQKMPLFISGVNALLLYKCGLPLTLFKHVLVPIVTPTVAFQLLQYFFDSSEEAPSLFGTCSSGITEQMLHLAGLLYGPYYLFQAFLALAKAYCTMFTSLPDVIMFIHSSWYMTQKKYHPVGGRELMLNLQTLLHQAKYLHWKTDKVVSLPIKTNLIECGQQMNEANLCCFLPMSDSLDMFIPFSFTAPLCTDDPMFHNPFDGAFSQVIACLKPGKTFASHVVVSLSKPGSLLLSRIHAYAGFKSDRSVVTTGSGGDLRGGGVDTTSTRDNAQPSSVERSVVGCVGVGDVDVEPETGTPRGSEQQTADTEHLRQKPAEISLVNSPVPPELCDSDESQLITIPPVGIRGEDADTFASETNFCLRQLAKLYSDKHTREEYYASDACTTILRGIFHSQVIMHLPIKRVHSPCNFTSCCKLRRLPPYLTQKPQHFDQTTNTSPPPQRYTRDVGTQWQRQRNPPKNPPISHANSNNSHPGDTTSKQTDSNTSLSESSCSQPSENFHTGFPKSSPQVITQHSSQGDNYNAETFSQPSSVHHPVLQTLTTQTTTTITTVTSHANIPDPSSASLWPSFSISQNYFESQTNSGTCDKEVPQGMPIPQSPTKHNSAYNESLCSQSNDSQSSQTISTLVGTKSNSLEMYEKLYGRLHGLKHFDACLIQRLFTVNEIFLLITMNGGQVSPKSTKSALTNKLLAFIALRPLIQPAVLRSQRSGSNSQS
ncbi:hypothetical protein Pelo_13039 [Pelomyxa schiedti]|nr:hypothetical protein Pelo_13039 [Pelomyxa schiedti]